MKARSTRRSPQSMASFTAAALLAMTAATAQVAAPQRAVDTGASLDTSGTYQSEVQACKMGKTAEDQATCLKEARNAEADRKRGLLQNSNGNLEANARARCAALSGEEKAACDARMLGYGTTSGSVAGGGVIREVETVVLPPGRDSVLVEPKTADPVVLVPVPGK